MLKKLLVFFLLIFAAASAQPTTNPQQALNQVNQTFFIPNQGQWNPEVKYLARIGGMNAWITNSGVVYDYYRIQKNFDETQTLKMNFQQKRDYENKNTTIEGDIVRMQLVNAESNVNAVGNNQQEGYYNYFLGNDKSKWANNVPLYDNIELRGVYKNINVKYYYDNGQLRYDYKAQPGADISQIKFKFDGQQGMRVNSNGELVLKTSIGEVTNGKIFAYQMDGNQQKEVPCQFEQIQDGSIGLKANSYDKKRELIIDPLVYSTFIGGSNYDNGTSIAIDASGNAFITGSTISTNYPTTSGAYQTILNDKYGTVFVTKLNSTGSSLVYSTFLGGKGSIYGGESGNSIAVDMNGNAYITGTSTSTNFPTTSGAFQTSLSGVGGDVFVTKLNSSGSALVYSTLIGGSSYDYGMSIAIDASGNAYITGGTSSSNFPITSGAYQTGYVGSGGDAFVTKLNSSGSALVYSTFIGGNNFDEGYSIAIDASGNAYITGVTNSSNYPTTGGAYQIKYGGSGNAFITKLNSIGNGLIYSTYIGGSGGDYGNSIAIDANGNAYITGLTWSSNYPTTTGTYQVILKGSNDAFVTKLNSIGNGLVYSTLLGGSNYDEGYSIAIDSVDNAYILGLTNSTNYPTTSGAYQTNYTLGSFVNAFVTKLNSRGSALVYSTFIGGNDSDQKRSMSIDGNGNVYFTGGTDNSTYPTTSGAYQTALSGVEDAFITKLNFIQLLPPGIITKSTTNITSNTSTLNGEVNANGQSTTVQFEYGTTASYGDSGAAIQGSISGNSNTNVSANITGLTPNTLYHFRIEATNSTGTSFGADSIFTTLVDTPGVAILISPNSSSVIVDTVPSITFTWQKAQYASTYELQISSDKNFTSLIADTSGLTDTVWTYNKKSFPMTFYWRVRGSNASVSGQWSSSMAVSLITGINEMNSGIPVVYQLMQNYPNPFNPSSKIRYALPFSSNVKIEVYNILGERIKVLVDEEKAPGNYEINFNIAGISSGVYFYIIEAKSVDGKSEFRDTKKMVLLK